jgi:hypothetical protein
MTLLLQPQLQQVSYQALSGYPMSMKKFWFTHYAGAQMVLFYSLFIWEDWDLSIWDGNLDAYVFWSNYVMRQWHWFRDGVLMMRWMCLPLLVLIICWEISLHFKDDLLNTVVKSFCLDCVQEFQEYVWGMNGTNIHHPSFCHPQTIRLAGCKMALKVLFLSLLFEQKEARDQLPNTSTTRTRPHHINMYTSSFQQNLVCWIVCF